MGYRPIGISNANSTRVDEKSPVNPSQKGKRELR